MGFHQFNRYKEFNIDGVVNTMPFIQIVSKSSDKRVVYRSGRDRLDRISFTYYGNPLFGWLILIANPQYGGLEFNIPDGTTITIPFPLNDALQEYHNGVTNYINLYGR